RVGDGARALRPDPLRPRRRRGDGGQESLTRRARHDAHRQPDLRLPPGRDRDPGRGAHLLPRDPPRTDRQRTHREVVLMAHGLRKDLVTGLIAIVAMTLVLGLAYPLAITGISQVFFSGAANGS